MRLVCLAILICFVGMVDAQKDPIRKELNRLIRYETGIDFKKTPGFIVGMIDEDTSFVFSFGQRAVDDIHPITKDDTFEIGGVTKIFTALLVSMLAEQGRLDLTRTINDYLPISNAHFDQCTLDQLLTHTSGLPKSPPGWGLIEEDNRNPYATFDQQDLSAFYASYPLNSTPPAPFLYSHLNYVLIEWILKNVFDKPFIQLQKDNLPPDLSISLNATPTVPGYDRQTVQVSPWTTSTFGAALGGKTNLSTLMNMCYYFLHADSPAYKQMMQPQSIIIRGESGYTAQGWQVAPIPHNRFLYTHTGRTEGHYAFVGILPDTHTAVTILANSASGTDVLGLSILRMMNRNWKRKGK